MMFVGMLGLDGGYQDLNSRMTHPMTFAEAAEWFKASCEYFAMAVKHDATLQEVTVVIYDSERINEITVEPIEQARFRKQ